MLSTELYRIFTLLEANEEVFPKGCLLFQEGDPVQFITVLKRGTLQVSSSGLTQNTHFQEISDKKRLWGIREMILGTDHSCTGQAQTEISCIRIPTRVVRRALRDNPPMRLMVMQAIASEITQMPHKVTD